MKSARVAAGIAWLLLTLALAIRLLHAPGHVTTFALYRATGAHWLAGEGLYIKSMGFVYSPLIAALFAPFALVPRAVGVIVWLALNTGVLLAGAVSVLRSGLFGAKNAGDPGWPLLLLLPLAIGNLDIGQANPLVIGLIMLGVAAAHRERWLCAALVLTLATFLKIYPLAIGLLLVLLAPRRFGLPFLLLLIAGALLPFLLQHWSYVQEQYRSWLSHRLDDNRLEYSERHMPLDLWLLLVRLGGLGIPASVYKALQVLGGGLIALYVVVGRWRHWTPERIYAGLFTLGCLWMILLGPATENYTYVLLGPAAAFALVQSLTEHRPPWLRALMAAAFALLLFAVARNSFLPKLNHIPWMLALQPVAALLFLGYALFWLLDDLYWKAPSPPARA